MKNVAFFSLGETFLGIGMRLGGGIMQFKMFGNTLYILAHPRVRLSLLCASKIFLVCFSHGHLPKENRVARNGAPKSFFYITRQEVASKQM